MSISAWPSIRPTTPQEEPKNGRQEHDHQRPADELAQRELPAENEGHDDPELDDQVRRGELECHRGGEVRALADHRLDGTREREAQDQRPEDLPEHPEGEAERVPEFAKNIDGEEREA